ncbi:MAG: hypothetical protein Q8Q09_11565 [Deltaproteobacteria bacterium]|nr:hypothetical protein [Deltaproteobacteria bacterium]
MSANRESKKTRMGYSLPHIPDAPGGSPTPSTAEPPQAPMQAASALVTPAYAIKPPSESNAAVTASRAAPIEIEYIRDVDPAASPATAVVLEVWTRNRIYHVDANMLCIDVINRASGASEPHHSLKGTRLTGGQRRSRSTMAIEIVVPYPVPGTEAVFKHMGKRGAQYGQTSTVERVVLKIRKIVVGSIGAEPAWDEITGRFQAR